MFHSNAVSRNLLLNIDSSPNNYAHIALSGLTSQLLVVPLIVAPLERIKVIMQTNSEIGGQLACAKQIIQKEGFKGLFKGTLITYARDMPSFATYFFVYEYLQDKVFSDSSQGRTSIGTITSGALAGKLNTYIVFLRIIRFANKTTSKLGIAGWTVAIPSDVVKSNHQCDPNSKSAISAAMKLFKLQGVRGFFLGAGPILLRAGE